MLFFMVGCRLHFKLKSHIAYGDPLYGWKLVGDWSNIESVQGVTSQRGPANCGNDGSVCGVRVGGVLPSC